MKPPYLIICALLFAGAAVADTPDAKLPSSTNPQVRQVVERIDAKLTVVEQAQEKTDSLLDTQGKAIATLDKSIEKNAAITEKVFEDSKRKDGEITALRSELKEKWWAKFVIVIVTIILAGGVGLLLGYMAARKENSRVIVTSAPAPPPVAQGDPDPVSRTPAPDSVSTREREEYKQQASKAVTRKPAAKRK